MTFEESVTQFIKDHDLIQPSARLVVGVSGGADSMALLQYLFEKKDSWGLELSVVSVDHGLRGSKSKEDLEYVASFCRERAINFYGRTVDAARFARKEHLSIETAARRLRYEIFAKAVQRFCADALVLAHHGDDQIETMLMREVRGSIGPARAGIPIRRPFAGAELVRPLLGQTKADLEAFCSERGIRPREDETNSSDAHTRNRFRKYVLPFLKQENPSVHQKFQYESERIAEDEQYLTELASERIDQVVTEKEKHRIKLSVAKFAKIPIPLQRRVIHLILNYLYNSNNMRPLHQSIHIEQIQRLIHSGRSSAQVHLPGGLSARKSYTVCLIGFSRLDNEGIKAYDMILRIPGKTSFSAGSIEAYFSSSGLRDRQLSEGGDIFIIDEQAVCLPLTVRTWQPGDRMIPEGMDGSQKVQRIFINNKIDRAMRAVWPLVVDGKGRVLWLPLIRRGRISAPKTVNYKTNNIRLIFTPAEDFGRI